MARINFSHLKEVGETYWQHLSWCLYSIWTFGILIPIAFIHGLFPFLLSNVPDRILVDYNRKFKERRERTGQSERYPE